jgi:uncharacterized membrane protein
MIRIRAGGKVTSCLVAAALWAISISLFRPLIARFGPAPVNFFKCAFASLAYFAWLALVGRLAGLAALDPGAIGQLALSGFVGMAIGDSLLFSAVEAGGDQRTLVIYNSAPLMTALLAWAAGGAVPSTQVWLGHTTMRRTSAIPRMMPSPARNPSAHASSSCGVASALIHSTPLTCKRTRASRTTAAVVERSTPLSQRCAVTSSLSPTG